MPARLSSRRFVGRVGELAELTFVVAEASAGRPTLVLVGGDSGVGKTRLVTELRAQLAVSAEPPLVLSGDAVVPAEGELPYAPLLGALRPLVRDHDPVLEALHPSTRAELATLLPGLDSGQTTASGASEPATVPGDRDGADERSGSGQLRLFEAVLALLDVLGERSPVLLVLEDLHWADRSTRTFLAFLARSLRTERVAVLVTYRSDELHRRHPLRPLLAELARLERVRTLSLEPLDRDELALALTDILGAPPDAALLARLFTRSEGNPLYTEELLAAGLNGRGAPPRTLSDTFLGRIEGLGADGQRVARALSLGRSLDERALGELTGLAPDPLRAALREAVAEQLLVASDDGSLRFRHALLREAVYDDLLPGERGELHTTLARHLESQVPVGEGEDARTARVLSIAYHHLAAGDQPAALRASVAAAEAARRSEAPGDAAELYQRALELWPRVPDPESLAGIDHVVLLRRAATTLSLIDERPRADSLLRQALDELDPAADPARCAIVLAQRGRVLWALNRGEEALELGQRALAMIPADDPLCDRAYIHGWVARIQFLRGRFREARSAAEVALAGARETGDRHAETELLNTLGMIRVALGEVEEGLSSLRDAIALARARGDLNSLAYATSNLADVLMHCGRITDALGVARAGLAEVPRGHVGTRDWLALTVSELAFQSGDWALAAQALEQTREGTGGTLGIFRRVREAELAAGIGDEQPGLERLDSIADDVAASTQPQWISACGSLRGELLARRGDLDAAQAAVQEALDRIEVCTDDAARVSAIGLVGVSVQADRAQRARDLGDAATRRDALARARQFFDRVKAAADDGGPRQRLGLALATAELARARGRPAARAWAAAAEASLALELPYLAARARWREAEDHVARGDREAATLAVQAAVRAAAALGARWLEREARGLAERARLPLEEVADQGVPAARARDDPFGLTDRERQVLALVSQGATNRQVGETLYMAEKTASVHVSRILAKLGVSSRTEAAAVAHRLHLT